MKSTTLFRLMIFGAVSATLGWVVCFLPPVLGHVTSKPTVGFGSRWALFLSIPAPFGAVLALCFPLWQRLVNIRNPLAQSILFWVVVVIVVLTGYSLILFGPTVAFSSLFSLRFLSWIVSGAAAGVCFHILDVITGSKL